MGWKNNKYIILTLVGWLAAMAVFYFTLFRPRALERLAGEEADRAVAYELGAFLHPADKERGRMVMQPYLTEVRAFKESKAANVTRLKDRLAIKPSAEFLVGPEEKFPGAYFKKILDRKRNDLLQEAARRNIEIPDDLGFGEALPPDAQAADLLRILYIKERLMRIALEAGVQAVTAIGHAEMVRTGPSREMRFINEYPVTMKFRGTLAATLGILYRMRGGDQFFVLRNLEIASANRDRNGREESLGVTVDVAGMSFDEVRAGDLRPAAVEPKPGPSGVPLGI
ncbi:MAG: hypothetical protein ABIF71_08155 [Planctomycetota bacterium]